MFEKIVTFLIHPKRSLLFVLAATLACAIECFFPGFIAQISFACEQGYKCTMKTMGHSEPGWGCFLLFAAFLQALYLHHLYK